MLSDFAYELLSPELKSKELTKDIKIIAFDDNRDSLAEAAHIVRSFKDNNLIMNALIKWSQLIVKCLLFMYYVYSEFLGRKKAKKNSLCIL